MRTSLLNRRRKQIDLYEIIYNQQECIPVGCVQSAAVAAGGRGCVSQHALSMGACIPACTGQGGGVSAQGVSAQGGSAQGGLPQCIVHAGIHTPTVDRMTDACENITLLQLRCGR